MIVLKDVIVKLFYNYHTEKCQTLLRKDIGHDGADFSRKPHAGGNGADAGDESAQVQFVSGAVAFFRWARYNGNTSVKGRCFV